MCAPPEQRGAAWSHYSEEQQPVWHLCVYIYEENPPAFIFLPLLSAALCNHGNSTQWLLAKLNISALDGESDLCEVINAHQPNRTRLKKKMKCSFDSRSLVCYSGD